MQNEIGIAGWLYSRQILQDQPLTLLELPAKCVSHGVKVVGLCFHFFASQEARCLNQLRQILEDPKYCIDMGNIAGALNRVVEGYRELTDVGPASGSKTVDGKCTVACPPVLTNCQLF